MKEGLSLLIDFVNVKKWSAQQLQTLQQIHGFHFTRYGDEHGYDYIFFREKKGFYYLIDENAPRYQTVQLIDDEECFSMLISLQMKWREILTATRANGPDVNFLNEISRKVKYHLISTGDPFVPRVGPFEVDYNTIEEVLEFAYLDVFIFAAGKFFIRLRECNYPECRNIFIYRRSKQKFCNDDCRNRYHNAIKIKSGYMAEHQAKGRREKPDVYLKK